MKPDVITALLAFCLSCGATALSAQPVYQSRGANGPVYSDKPQAGAKAVELRPLNVIDSATLTGGNAAEKGAAPSAPQKAGVEKPGDDKSTGNKEAAPVLPQSRHRFSRKRRQHRCQ